MAFSKDDNPHEKSQHYMVTGHVMSTLIPVESPIEASMLPRPYNIENASSESRDDFKL